MITRLAETWTAQPRFPSIDVQLQKELVQVFKLLADENRLKILLDLARDGELHVSAICDRLGQSQPAVSHHLALLRVAGLITCRRDGKHNFYAVRKQHFVDLLREVLQRVGGGSAANEIRFDGLVVRQEREAIPTPPVLNR